MTDKKNSGGLAWDDNPAKAMQDLLAKPTESIVKPDEDARIPEGIRISKRAGLPVGIPACQPVDIVADTSTNRQVSRQVSELVLERARTPVGRSRYRPTSYRMLDTDVDWIDAHALQSGRRKQDILTDAIALYRDLLEGKGEQ